MSLLNHKIEKKVSEMTKEEYKEYLKIKHPGKAQLKKDMRDIKKALRLVKKKTKNTPLSYVNFEEFVWIVVGAHPKDQVPGSFYTSNGYKVDKTTWEVTCPDFMTDFDERDYAYMQNNVVRLFPWGT